MCVSGGSLHPMDVSRFKTLGVPKGDLPRMRFEPRAPGASLPFSGPVAGLNPLDRGPMPIPFQFDPTFHPTNPLQRPSTPQMSGPNLLTRPPDGTTNAPPGSVIPADQNQLTRTTGLLSNEPKGDLRFPTPAVPTWLYGPMVGMMGGPAKPAGIPTNYGYFPGTGTWGPQPGK